MPLDSSPLAFVVAGSEPSCPEVLIVIQCYVDCECDVDTMLTIASHLDRCAHCADELETLRWLKSAVRRCAGAPESRSWL
jgi:anti-sigma factor RsiW